MQPYIESLPDYIDGALPWHPLTRAMELRPHHWSTTLKYHQGITHWPRTNHAQSIKYTHNLMPTTFNHPHSYPNIESYQLILCISHQYHVSLMPTISFNSHAKFIPNPSFPIHESHHSCIIIYLMLLI